MDVVPISIYGLCNFKWKQSKLLGNSDSKCWFIDLVNLRWICGLRCKENINEWMKLKCKQNDKFTRVWNNCNRYTMRIYNNIQMWLAHEETKPICHISAEHELINSHALIRKFFFLHFSRFFPHQFFPKWLIMMTIDNWFNLPQYVHALIVSRSSIPTINMPKCIKIWKIKIKKIKLKIVCRNNNSTDYDMVNTNWIYLTENKMLLSELR